MKNEIIRDFWAGAIFNGELLCVETRSGYRGGSHGDPKGKQIFLPSDASDEALGLAVLEALAHSRWVLGAPRPDIVLPDGVEFDSDLYDYKKNQERYAQWVKDLMERFGCKTKRALFKDMENCAIEVKGDVMKIVPNRHVKLEAWEGLGPNSGGAVELPANSKPAEVGAALRLAFVRCKEWPNN